MHMVHCLWSVSGVRTNCGIVSCPPPPIVNLVILFLYIPRTVSNLKFSVSKSFCVACIIFVPFPSAIRMLPHCADRLQSQSSASEANVMSVPHFWLGMRPAWLKWRKPEVYVMPLVAMVTFQHSTYHSYLSICHLKQHDNYSWCWTH